MCCLLCCQFYHVQKKNTCYKQVFTVQHLPQYVCWYIQERFILKFRDQQITPWKHCKIYIDLIQNRNYATFCNDSLKNWVWLSINCSKVHPFCNTEKTDGTIQKLFWHCHQISLELAKPLCFLRIRGVGTQIKFEPMIISGAKMLSRVHGQGHSERSVLP